MMYLRDRASYLRRISSHEVTPAQLEQETPGILRSIGFSERHYLHWCHVRGWEPALPEVFHNPDGTPEGAVNAGDDEAMSNTPDWPALVAAAPERGVKKWLKERGISPPEFYRQRNALAGAA